MISATFLEAKVGRLAKTVSTEGIEPYPNAKQFRSDQKLLPDLRAFANALVANANAGNCLLVGDLIRPLDGWGSRAGLANRNSEMRWFVIDIDGLKGFAIPSPLDRASLGALAKTVVRSLESVALNDVSFIAHASTKMGLSQDKVNLHLFFQLDGAVHSQQLKQWLKNLNLNAEVLNQNIRLSANGHALTWPVDVSCADTGRLIYLAPPIFHGTTDPFPSAGDRFALVEGSKPAVEAGNIRSAAPNELVEGKIKARLREAAGLPPRERAKMRTLSINGAQVEVLLNPAAGVLTHVRDGRGFSYYNLNDGDSAAYYHPEFRPEIIFNFKGEPAFRWVDVDPTGYERYCADHAEEIARVDPINVFMVINKVDDRIYKVWHDHEASAVACVPSSREQVKDFYTEYGKIEPLFMPTWAIDYMPNGPFQVDYTGKTINLFVPSEIMKNGLTETLPEPLTASNMIELAKRCPTIYFLLDHLAGHDREAVGHFLNWLAVILQKRCKTETAWIFQGTEGTGKGTLYKEVLIPMFGEANVSMRSNEDLTDAFNAWRKNKLVVCVDEFEIPNSPSGRALIGKLRNWIVEPRAAIRAMHRVGEDSLLFDNWVFFSNQHNMLPIPENDRRYNVCPRQERKLREVCDTVELYQGVRNEIATFGSLMHGWDANVDLAKICLNNSAKKVARAASRTMAEEFGSCLTEGDLDFMLQIFETQPAAIDPGTAITLDSARRTVRTMIAKRDATTFFSSGEMTALYNAMFEQRLSILSFSKMLARMGLNNVRGHLPDGARARGYELRMNKSALSDEDLDRIIAPSKPTLQAVQ